MNNVLSFITIGDYHHGSQRQKNQFYPFWRCENTWLSPSGLDSESEGGQDFTKTLYIPEDCIRSTSLLALVFTLDHCVVWPT